MKWHTADENGETGAEKWERFYGDSKSAQIPAPPPRFILPVEGKYLWDWFFDLNDNFSRIADGVVSRIPPSEFLAWANITGNIVHVREYDILRAMDAEYCVQIQARLDNERKRRDEAAAQEREAAAKSKRGFRRR